MKASFEKAHAVVSQLADNFEAHRREYSSAAYTEAAVRKDFIDKFFTALGWDVDHNVQINPFQQEVRVERNVADGPAKRRADYAFCIAPNFRDVRFFAEAKKPFGGIANRDDYFQTIRYAWNSQSPVALLTDFEELHVLDCRYKPDIDTALERVVTKYHFSHYKDSARFAEIFHLFGRSAVADGAIERFAADLPKRRGKAFQRGLFRGGYQGIDELFLVELDRHREVLARSLKADNPSLSGPDLTEVTQRILDRLVFIRFLEDKLIEPEYLVSSFGDRGSVWGDFVAASRRLDATYNGIVFKKHPLLDSPRLIVDDAVFGDVCEEMSHINSPYDFNAIPIHILGSIYERFLGKIIVATDKRARIEPSREARRAGGVYYTPEYVVRYLVEQTVGKLLTGKSPNQIAGMRFADIACGSGSFLLGVYDLLLQYHGEWYNANPTKVKPGECVDSTDGTLHLSLSKRREILLNNIHGVDVDAQAVEVAQLSLYLKLLEEESTSTARSWQLEFHTTLLPPLTNNILCGNSLIESDILDGELLSEDIERELNPMDIKTRFRKVMESGGFDAIVGNPPYVRPHRLTPMEKEYLWAHFTTFTHKADLYCCFIERATQLLKASGLFGYIVSHGWLRLNSFQKLRLHILDNYRIKELVELPYRVFADAVVDTGLLVLEREAVGGRLRNRIKVKEGKVTDLGFEALVLRTIPQRAFRDTFQNVFDLSLAPDTEVVKDQMRKGPRIGELFAIQFGLKTADDAKFLHKEAGRHREDRKLLRGDDVKRYFYDYKGEYVWYVPNKMRAHRKTARPGEPERFEQPKVLVKDTSTDFACAYDSENFYVKDVLIIIPLGGVQGAPDLRFVAGVINSRALRFYYRTTFKTLHVQNEELASLPLPLLDLTKAGDRLKHDLLVRLVDQIQEATRKAASARTHAEGYYYNAKCIEMDEKIDDLVCDLYGLTKEQRAIVKAAAV